MDRRQGFLPIETNWFDRLFISVVIWVALSLPTIAVSVIGGIAVGLSALAARAGRGSERVEYLS